MKPNYREGILGALMDEYCRAGEELRSVIFRVRDEDFVRQIDAKTHDPDCISIQTVLSHVVRSGFGYADYLRKEFEIPTNSPNITILSKAEGLQLFGQMIEYTEITLESRWSLDDESISASKIQSRHGPVYTIEQLLEHAIVHILRHRRQIEKLLCQPSFEPSNQ